jgi:hypothetical protein
MPIRAAAPGQAKGNTACRLSATVAPSNAQIRDVLLGECPLRPCSFTTLVLPLVALAPCPMPLCACSLRSVVPAALCLSFPRPTCSLAASAGAPRACPAIPSPLLLRMSLPCVLTCLLYCSREQCSQAVQSPAAEAFISDQARYQAGAACQKNSPRTSTAPSGSPELALCDAWAF